MTLGWWTLQWHTPAWLLLVPVVVLIVAILRATPARRSNLARLVDAHLLPWLVRDAHRAPRHDALLAVACVLGAIAAAGPYLSGDMMPTARRALDIAIVIDISPSMTAADVSPSRLQRAQRAAHELLARSPTDRHGLVAFSAHAYPLLPLTHDFSLVRDVIDTLDPALTTRKGSALAGAVRRAMAQLETSPRGSRTIIVLSDGEAAPADISSLATDLTNEQIPVLAVGFGTEQGAAIRNDDQQLIEHNGVPVWSTLQREPLQTLAQATGGAYRDDSNLDLGSWFDTQLSTLSRQIRYDVTSPQEQPLAAWFLLASVALLLWWSRAHSSALASVGVVVLTLLPVPQAEAAPWRDVAAHDALQDGDLQKAEMLYANDDDYAAHLGRGAIAYKRGDFAQAQAAFTLAQQRASSPEYAARAAYNLGNAYARLQQLEDAARAFRAALQHQPNYPRAALNLSLVTAEQQRLAARDRPSDTDQARPGDSTSASVRNAGAATTPDARPEQQSTDRHTGTGRDDWRATSPEQPGADTRPWLAENTRAWLQKRFTQLDQSLTATESERPW